MQDSSSPSKEKQMQNENHSSEKVKNEPSPSAALKLPAYVKQIKKKELDDLLKCPLCNGFFRDAHTINECLCSFCKSCIYKYYWADAKRESCPKCEAKLGGKPLKSVIADASL